MKDFRHKNGDVIVAFGIVALVISLCIGSGVALDSFIAFNHCQQMQELTQQYEFQWIFWGGCRVRLENGYWLNVQDYEDMYGDFNLADE